MHDCYALLADLENLQNEIGEEARNVRETFNALVEEVRHQEDNMETADVLDLANRFFRTTSSIYTLAAMAPPQPANAA